MPNEGLPCSVGPPLQPQQLNTISKIPKSASLSQQENKQETGIKPANEEINHAQFSNEFYLSSSAEFFAEDNLEKGAGRTGNIYIFKFARKFGFWQRKRLALLSISHFYGCRKWKVIFECLENQIGFN